jgi:hypothetical protein
MQLGVTFKGKLISKLKDARSNARRLVERGVLDASTFLMEATIRETPASVGNLRKSIRREITGEGLRAAIFTDLEYGMKLHGDGIAQRTRPFTIPEIEAQPGGTLYRWAKKKGMNPWAVRASIRRKGIKHNPFMKRAAEQSEEGIVKILGRAAEDVVNWLAD